MSIARWLSNRFGVVGGAESRRTTRVSRRPVRPALEALEGRRVPSTLTVTNNLNSGPGSLRTEISSAHNGDTITFAPSLDGQIITLKSGELLLNKNLTITGPGASQLTISGNNASRVFEVATGFQVNLSGLTISNGLASSGNGGGILVDASAVLTLSNSTLSGNNATFNNKGVGGHGGGIDNFGTATVSGCNLSGNCAVGGDSAIYNGSGSTLTVNNNSAVSGNSSIGIANIGNATINGGAVSGNSLQGIYNFSAGTVKVSGCTLSHNSSNMGGGIYNNGSATITGCTLSDNSATDQGGGIYSSTSTGLTVTDSTLSGNSAQNYGGGIMVVAGTATISGCTFSGNTAGAGGGIFLYGGPGATLTLSGSTLDGNTAIVGGGIYVSVSSSVTVSNSQLFSNSATQAGGGIYIDGGITGVPDGTVTVENSSSITGDTAPAGFGADVYNLGVLHVDPSSTIGILDGKRPT